MSGIPPAGDDPVRTFSRRAKPKPLSVHHRFILMQDGIAGLALLLMSLALSANYLIQSRFSARLAETQSALGQGAQIRSAFDSATLAFWAGYSSGERTSIATYRDSSRKAQDLSRQFAASAPARAERAALERLEWQEKGLFTVADQLLAGPRDPRHDRELLAEAAKRQNHIQLALEGAAEASSDDLRARASEMKSNGRAMFTMFIALGVFVAMALWPFRRAHQEYIWEPLEKLRRMLLEVKRGNLDLTAEVPPTVEIGSLFEAFLQMASELRGMRDSLEDKVRQRAAELAMAQKDLLQAAKLASLGQLVSGVAHEINNPLTSVLGFSEIVLGRPGLEPSIRAPIQTIHGEALRLKSLVANLGRFARRAPHHVLHLDLRTVADRLLELRHYQLLAENIHVHFSRPERPVWIKGDPDLLLQVLLNLVLNAEQAIRSCRQKGDIWLSCGWKKANAWITVRDNGCGMSSEVRDHIFDPFFTTRPMGQGTGLGLSISHGIMQQHEGKLTVESEPAKGTTMGMILPAVAGDAVESEIERRPAAASAPEVAIQASTHSGQPLRILAIDDEPEILSLVSHALSSRGMQVTSLEDSTKLPSVLGSGSFDAVICDLKMPGWDGLAVLRFLREKQPAMAAHFLLVTGNPADADKGWGDLDRVPILQKPFTLSRLAEMLEQVTSDAR